MRARFRSVRFSVSIGFHSGSGKSAENYEVCGKATGGNLEVKTSGRCASLFALLRPSQPSWTSAEHRKKSFLQKVVAQKNEGKET